MPEDTKKDKKEKTLSLKTNTKSSKSTIGTRSRGSSRVSTVVVESKRGKISKTRKPSAPNIKTRTSSVTSRKIKEPTENDVFGALTDKERTARKKALLDADIRKKDEVTLEKEISKEQNISEKTKAKKEKSSVDLPLDAENENSQKKKSFTAKKSENQISSARKKESKGEDKDLSLIHISEPTRPY